MDERECMKTEALGLIQRADTNTINVLVKLLKLGTSSPGFMKAFAAATPPGEECPPVDVIKVLVNEWAEKEGLE